MNEHSISLQKDILMCSAWEAVSHWVAAIALRQSQGLLCGGAALQIVSRVSQTRTALLETMQARLVQHFSYCYVIVPGPWTFCRGQRTGPGFPSRCMCGLHVCLTAENKLKEQNKFSHRLGLEYLFVFCWNFLHSGSKVTTCLFFIF